MWQPLACCAIFQSSEGIYKASVWLGPQNLSLQLIPTYHRLLTEDSALLQLLAGKADAQVCIRGRGHTALATGFKVPDVPNHALACDQRLGQLLGSTYQALASSGQEGPYPCAAPCHTALHA